MQPSPRAETVGPSGPSVRSFIGALCTHAAAWSDPGMDYELGGKVALVTGAASGIGRATTELLAAMGARVVACDVDAEAGEAVASLREPGAEARFVAADVTDGGRGSRSSPTPSRVRPARLRGQLRGRRRRPASTHEYPVDEWDRIVAVNLRGRGSRCAPSSRRCSRGRRRRSSTSSSTLGLRGSPFGSPYSASKHGVLGLTRTAAIEYAPRHPRQRGVPGRDRHADDGRHLRALPRLPRAAHRLRADGPHGRPAEVAGAIAWLSSDAASFVTGEALTVEGGLLAR